MKTLNNKLRIIYIFFMIFSFVMVSCKKDKNFDLEIVEEEKDNGGEVDDEENGNAGEVDEEKNDKGGEAGELGRGIRMEIDGKPWMSDFYFTLTGMLADDEEDSDMVYDRDYYTVTVTGMDTEALNTELDFEDITTWGLNLLIPVHKSKFNNPKGEYPLGIPLDQNPTAMCLYYDGSSLNDSDEAYLSFDDKNPAISMGKVTVEEFEIGTVTFFGFPTGETGYTRIAGTFAVDLNKYKVEEVDDEGGTDYREGYTRLDGSVKITKGSFNVRNDDFIEDITGLYSSRLQVDVPFMNNVILKK